MQKITRDTLLQVSLLVLGVPALVLFLLAWGSFLYGFIQGVTR